MTLTNLFRPSRVCLAILLYLPISAFSATLIFTAPPRETVEAGTKIYAPIANYLSKLLGKKVTYVHPKNWFNYQREMRKDKYDIILDGPHFASWRIAHLGHEALVKLPGKLRFLLLVDKNNPELDHADKLIGKNICAISPPHLSVLAILDNYRNPVRQPVIKGIKGGMGKVFKSYKSKKKKCHALVLRDVFLKKKIKKDEQDKLRVVYSSVTMPNQAITVSKRVTQEEKNKIKFELTVGEGVASTQGVIKRFAGKAKSFIPVKAKEYDGYNMLLEGVIWGW